MSGESDGGGGRPPETDPFRIKFNVVVADINERFAYKRQDSESSSSDDTLQQDDDDADAFHDAVVEAAFNGDSVAVGAQVEYPEHTAYSEEETPAYSTSQVVAEPPDLPHEEEGHVEGDATIDSGFIDELKEYAERREFEPSGEADQQDERRDLRDELEPDFAASEDSRQDSLEALPSAPEPSGETGEFIQKETDYSKDTQDVFETQLEYSQQEPTGVHFHLQYTNANIDFSDEAKKKEEEIKEYLEEQKEAEKALQDARDRLDQLETSLDKPPEHTNENVKRNGVTIHLNNPRDDRSGDTGQESKGQEDFQTRFVYFLRPSSVVLRKTLDGCATWNSSCGVHTCVCLDVSSWSKHVLEPCQMQVYPVRGTLFM